MHKKIVILHNQIHSQSADELDVLNQRDLVRDSCEKLGYEVTSIAVGSDVQDDIKKVQLLKPDIVFNLVESCWGKGELLYVAPALLNALKMPYTGVPLDALFLSTNKVIAKKIMGLYNLPTANFYGINEMAQLNPAKKYIVKPIWEEASVGIDSDSVFTIDDSKKMKKISELPGSHYFIEEYIDGREFNVSILTHENGCEVLYPAEMIFSSFFDTRPKIVGYKAKWDEQSQEFKHTNRALGTLEKQLSLKTQLQEVSKKVWKVFNLHGYARVDFRVDKNDKVYILEINGNPCIAPDSGFIAATNYAAYSNEKIIKRILDDTN